ncbi:MAG TPA: methionyl-tRNA formyltransferase [Rhizomicrobium sp.]|nr:methionyl-tRNA formyltransferase [Rhizomicrobium sp.]
MTLRLAFMGTPDFAVPTLAALIAQGHDIAALYTQPPRPKGRGLSTEPSPVAKLGNAHGIEVRNPVSLKGEAEQLQFAQLNLDAAIVVAYGLLLPKAVLDAPRLGCINLHGSLLPRWRGAAPIHRAIMAGDSETGVMTMQMEEGLDTGPVLMAERTDIGRKTTGELHDQLAHLGADLMVRTLAALERGSITAQPQTGEPTYAKKILKDETRIDWSKPAAEVDRHIRGLSPFPGAWTEANGERLKILTAEPAKGQGAPGQILDDTLTIACGDGALKLTRLQRAGKGPMNAADLLHGFSLPRGTLLV